MTKASPVTATKPVPPPHTRRWTPTSTPVTPVEAGRDRRTAPEVLIAKTQRWTLRKCCGPW